MTARFKGDEAQRQTQRKSRSQWKRISGQLVSRLALLPIVALSIEIGLSWRPISVVAPVSFVAGPAKFRSFVTDIPQSEAPKCERCAPKKGSKTNDDVTVGVAVMTTAFDVVPYTSAGDDAGGAGDQRLNRRAQACASTRC